MPPTHCWPLPHGTPEVPQLHAPFWQRSALKPLQPTQALPPRPHAPRPGVVQLPPLQQPLGQLVPSHTHSPPTQRWPAEQAAEPPQRQLPPEQLSALSVLQAPQLAPLVPHWVTVGGLTHAPLLQQPVGQLVASQTHAPLTQRWPVAHAKPEVPQLHFPATHRSAVVGLHDWHAAPPAPHDGYAPDWHWLPAQQPLEQLVASHTHVLFTQRWPAPHAEPLPQRHEPFVQLSANVRLHAVHVAPLLPHCEVVSVVTHVLPLQQPPEQLPELQPWQLPIVHAWFIAHAAHVPPPVPHADATLPGRHVLPWQQPDAQLVESHTHAPPTQRCPAPHGALAPHWHAPFAQRSAVVGLHVVHAAPPMPQLDDAVPAWQVLPWQQPLGQLVASHTHAPPAQRCPAPHAAPPPHWQVPFTHWSAVVALHAAHAPPVLPHAVVALPGWHAPP